MLDGATYVIIWRDAPERMVSCVADDDKAPRVFTVDTLPDEDDLIVCSDESAEGIIQQDTFQRAAVSTRFAKNVLGWDV